MASSGSSITSAIFAARSPGLPSSMRPASHAVDDRFPKSANSRRNHGRTARKRFQRGEAQPFGATHLHAQIRSLVVSWQHLRRMHGIANDHSVGYIELFCQLQELLMPPGEAQQPNIPIRPSVTPQVPPAVSPCPSPARPCCSRRLRFRSWAVPVEPLRPTSALPTA